jgi:hypothetical protein
MNPQTISDLLPAFRRSDAPDAYEIVGITGPQPDMNRVLSAIKQTIERLKSLQNQTPADAWAQATATVRQAKETLADPVLKAELDQKLRSAKNTSDSSALEFDPLAGILPTTDPLKILAPSAASVKPTPQPATIQTRSLPIDDGFPVPVMPGGPNFAGPSPVVSTPRLTFPAPAAITTSGVVPAPIVVPVPRSDDIFGASGFVPPQNQEPPIVEVPGHATLARPRQRRPKRRTSPIMTCLMSLVTVSLIAIVGFLGYITFVKQGTIAISTSGNQVVVSTQPIIRSFPTLASQPRQLQVERPPRDPVFNSRVSAESPLRSMLNETVDVAVPEDVVIAEGIENLGAMSEPSPMMAGAALSESSSVMPGMEPTAAAVPSQSNEPTEEQLKKNAIEIKQAVQLIRDRDWQRMVPAIERLREVPLDESQDRSVEGLYDTAFLFAFYRGGIERGMGKQEVGMSFEIVPGFTVGVVSAREGAIELKIDGKIQRFEIESLPLNLADRLAAEAIDEGPTRDLASAIYHCLAGNSTAEVQKSELAWIRGFGQPIEDVDPKQVARAIEAVLGGP